MERERRLDIPDLIGFCEEIVADVSKRMRLSDTIMSPISRRRATNESGHDLSQIKPGVHPEDEGAEEKYFSVILFDARSVDNRQVASNSGLRIILENLLVSIWSSNLAWKKGSDMKVTEQCNSVCTKRLLRSLLFATDPRPC